MRNNVVVAAYVLEIEGDIEPKLRGPYKSPDTRDRGAKRLRTKDQEKENGIFALDLMNNGKVRVWAYSAGFLDGTFEARDEKDANRSGFSTITSAQTTAPNGVTNGVAPAMTSVQNAKRN